MSKLNKKVIKIEEIKSYKLKKIQKLYLYIKTVMDFFIALITLTLLSILFIVVAIAIKCDSKGPVFFKQKRVGRNGKLFTCIKFRSMSQEANHEVAGYEYGEVSSYITKVGKFLRKTSIDELPQLFNMLFGQMSLIGYRPSQSNEIELTTAREQFMIYQVKPGLTGWAQVHGRDVLAAHPTEKAKYDAYYLYHFSFALDVKLFFMTIKSVLKHDGIEEGVIVEEKPVAENIEVASSNVDTAMEEVAVTEDTKENKTSKAG